MDEVLAFSIDFLEKVMAPYEMEREGLALMTDNQAEQSYHRWLAWTNRMNEARKK